MLQMKYIPLCYPLLVMALLLFSSCTPKSDDVLWKSLKGPSLETGSIDFSPDNLRIAAGGLTGEIVVLEVDGGKEVWSQKAHSGSIFSVAFDPMGRSVATGANDGFIKMWDFRTGKELRTLESGIREVRAVGYSPNGKLIATTGEGVVTIWHTDTGQKLHAGSNLRFNSKGRSTAAGAIAFSADNRLIAASNNHTLSSEFMIWEIASGKPIWETEKEQSFVVRSLKFGPQGKVLASGGVSSGIQIWDVQSGNKIKELDSSMHTYSMIFNSKGDKLASAQVGWTKKIMFWNISSGTNLKTENMQTFSAFVSGSAAFSLNGAYLATAGGSSGIDIWRVQWP